MNDERLHLLRRWLQHELDADDFTIAPASGDASFRRYFRVTHGRQSHIAMDAPPGREDVAPFVHVAGLLAGLGLHAPAVHGCDPQQGFVLLEDLGDRTYFDALTAGADVEPLYDDALGALVRMQSMPGDVAVTLPPYDAALLERELHLFRDWLCVRHLGLALSDAERAALATAFALLTEAALEQPRVFVHRDYHSRNLMVCAGRNPGILDFQDAVHGPVTYDLVSLLRDCYVAWPAGRVQGWVLEYREMAASRGVAAGRDSGQYLRWFDLMGVQRQLKAAGIFARLCHRDGKRGYLAEVPRTLGYVVEVAPRYPELRCLAGLIADRVLPALEAAPACTR